MVSSSFPSSTITDPQSETTPIKVTDSESAEVTLAPLDIVLPDGPNVTIPAGTPVLGLQYPWHHFGTHAIAADTSLVTELPISLDTNGSVNRKIAVKKTDGSAICTESAQY